MVSRGKWLCCKACPINNCKPGTYRPLTWQVSSSIVASVSLQVLTVVILPPPPPLPCPVMRSADIWSGGSSVGELLCLKLLPQFSCQLNKTCYTLSPWRVDVHDINCVRPGQSASELCPLLRNSYISLLPVAKLG